MSAGSRPLVTDSRQIAAPITTMSGKSEKELIRACFLMQETAFPRILDNAEKQRKNISFDAVSDSGVPSPRRRQKSPRPVSSGARDANSAVDGPARTPERRDDGVAVASAGQQRPQQDPGLERIQEARTDQSALQQVAL